VKGREKDLDVMVSFDMESDIGSWTCDHRGVAEGTEPILAILAQHGVPGTFFYTGAAAVAAPDSLKAVLAAGHEIGCHTLHHESMGDPIVDLPIPPILPEEVEHRLAKATDLLERRCGTRPRSFRAPRGWASNAMLAALERLGYLVDSSYLAYHHKKHLAPYRPSSEDWRESGAMDILEVPLFCNPQAFDDPAPSREWDQWPMLRTKGGDYLADVVLRAADFLRYRQEPAVACIYLHPWEFVEMPATVNTGERALAEMDLFLGRLRDAGARWYTMNGFHALWTAQHPVS